MKWYWIVLIIAVIVLAVWFINKQMKASKAKTSGTTTGAATGQVKVEQNPDGTARMKIAA